MREKGHEGRAAGSPIQSQAVLDSLTAHIAVLEQEGGIVAVNAAWKRFAQDNGDATLAGTSINANYLAECRRAAQSGEVLAQPAADGIQDVIDGRRAAFSLEYPCHSPDESRWFVMRVTRLAGNGHVVVAHQNITDRVRAEEALRDSQQMYKALVRASPEAIVVIDLQGRVIEVSEQAAALYGAKSDAELLSLNTLDFVAPQDRFAVLRDLQRAGLEGQTRVAEYALLRRDGSRFIGELNASIIADAAGQPRALIATIRDITRRRQAEAALRESEERYRIVSEVVSDFAYAFRVESDGRLRREWMTDAFTRITGFAIDEVEGRIGWLQIVHPADAEIVARHIERVTTHRTDVSEFRITIRGGQTRWLRNHSQPVWEPDQGRVTRIIGAAQDITQRKRRERELEALVSIATALRAAPTRGDILHVVVDRLCSLMDADGCALERRVSETGETVIVLANGAWAGLAGVRFPPGSRLYEHVVTLGQPYLSHDVRRDSRFTQPDAFGVATAVVCVPLVAEDETIGALWIGRTTHVEGHDVHLLTAIADMAATAFHRATLHERTQHYAAELERRVAERTHELAEANQRLTELDRLKSKFVSDVSHELRAPVANLRLYADLIERGKPEKRPEYFHALRAQAERLEQLVADILNLSRLEMGADKARFAPVDLNALVEQVVTAHQPLAESAGLNLSFEPSHNLPPVRGERNQLAQVVTNLIANAINYTPEGSVRVRTYPNATGVILQVSDTGWGIAPEDMPHLFDRFYRGRHAAESRIPGSGLGLAIVKEIVDLHGGEIEAVSEVGAGSTFRVRLPIAHSAA